MVRSIVTTRDRVMPEQTTEVSDTSNSIEYGIVFYTDGGARPTNPGNIGWGSHGYRYTTEPSKRGTGLQKYHITNKGYIKEADKHLLKDGTKPVTPTKYFNFFGNELEPNTNNAAEVDAMYHSLAYVKQHENDVHKIQVYTDSEYLRRGITEWVDTWERRDWCRHDGTPIPNQHNWKRLKSLKDDLHQSGKDIQVTWVKGHAENFGNEKADKLATLGVLYAMDGQHRKHNDVSDSQGYWKSDANRHPFLAFRSLFFNSDSRYNIQGKYYLAEAETIGRRLPHAAYAVIKLKTPEKVIETLRNKQSKVAADVPLVVEMHLDKVYHKDVQPILEEHGEVAASPRVKGFDLEFIDREFITNAVNPVGHSLRAIEFFTLLEETLDAYTTVEHNKAYEITDQDPAILQSRRIVFHDITDRFFTREEVMKKKELTTVYKLHKDFSSGSDTMKFVKIDVQLEVNGVPRVVTIPLGIGLDILPRNNMKRLEPLSPKVTLATWRDSELAIRFATIISCADGVGIWANYFANQLFLDADVK